MVDIRYVINAMERRILLAAMSISLPMKTNNDWIDPYHPNAFLTHCNHVAGEFIVRRYLYLHFLTLSLSSTFADNIDPVSTFQGIDFGNIVVLRCLAITQWLDCGHSDEAITEATTRTIDRVHRGYAESRLEDLDFSLVVHGNYTGRSTWGGFEYSSLRKLRIDHLLDRYPMIQKVTFRIGISSTWCSDPDQ